MKRHLIVSLKALMVFTLLTGVAYPLFVTGVARVVFPTQASGSLLFVDDNPIGSRLIGQSWENARYFHGRPSASKYVAVPSGATNLGPTSAALKEAFATCRRERGAKVPLELCTSSGSGLDPHISPDGAYFQVERVAQARQMRPRQVAELNAMIEQHVIWRTFGILGQPRVNVLELNLALDRLFPEARP